MVGINCNGNEFYFYLQSGLIAVIRSKHILGLTTSLTLQTKLPHKLGPAGQLTMLSEKSVTWKMDLLLVFSLHGAFFYTSHYFDYSTNKAWQFLLLLLIKRVGFFFLVFLN